MNKRFIFGLIILLFIGVLTLVGYLKTRKVEEKPDVIEVEQETKPAPILVETQKIEPILPTPTPTLSETIPPTATPSPYQVLFNLPLLYLDLDYPLLYVYDPQESVIKYFNLEEETYREIYKVDNLENAFFSPDKTKILLKTSSFSRLLDLKTDKIINIPPFVKSFVFYLNDLVVYYNDQKYLSYLAFFREGKMEKIRDLGILNPEFALVKNNLLIYENNNPVFNLDLTRPSNFSLFLDKKESYSLLPNKNQDLIYVAFKEDGVWQSKVIDLRKKEKISFSWGTIREKCSFDEFLVCAVPLNLDKFDKEEWSFYTPSYDEKIVIYNPKNGEIKEINLEKPFDIVKPKLTPLGIIFWNRLDAKFYLIKPEQNSF